MQKAGPSYHSESQILFLHDLLTQIASGALQVPRFQRPFVWTDEQRLTLLESVRRGIPIGSILLWRTRHRELKSFQRLGPHLLPSLGTSNNGSKTYLLDGNQRLSTLFGALWPVLSPAIEDEQDIDQADVEWNILYDLLEEEFILQGRKERKENWLPLSIVLDSVRLIQFQRGLPESNAEKMIRAADELASAVRAFKIPVVTIVTDDLAEVTRTFQRINSQGTPMHQVHMITALTWDPDFDLSDRIEEMKEKVLDPIGWGELDDKTIVNVCKAALGLDIYETDVEAISRELKAQTEVLDQAGENLAKVADFLQKDCGIRSPQLVPYSHQIVLLAEAFRLSKVPLEQLCSRARTWFWLTTYAEAFAGINYSRLRAELGFVRRMAVEPKIPESSATPEVAPLPRRFDMRTARIKALSIRLAELQPRDLENQVIDGFEELHRHSSSALIHLIDRSKLATKSFYASPANRLLASPANAKQFRQFTKSSPLFGIPDLREIDHSADILKSHAITTAAARALSEEKFEIFLELRLQVLNLLEVEFVNSLHYS